ncbi:MAG: portal protein [Alphaproteobacteria bacterium]
MNEKLEHLHKRFTKAQEKKSMWEADWQECYAYAFPQRENAVFDGGDSGVHIYDGTAIDAVDQLASSLLAELTPPWAKWFGLKGGKELSEIEKQQVSKTLEETTDIVLQNFEHSNFSIELHQCYLDLVTAGTACLLFEEAPIGETSAFKFSAIPLSEISIEESASGKLDTTFRSSDMNVESILARFNGAILPEHLLDKKEDRDFTLKVIETVVPRCLEHGSCGYEYIVFVQDGGDYVLIKEGVFDTSPFINFRWQKAPGEVYGRSPVMKALPDIKTANKVVELVLKNASIAVTGIWQADDDGVINPANIKLVPGAIIPKAVDSKGLTPLEAPGKFDVSQLVLTDLRSRINHALLADSLSQVDSPNMTATEVLERSSQMARILGASFGRLQSELLTPLLKRAFNILRRRGEILNFEIDGKIVDIQYKSPLALVQSRKDVSNIAEWVNLVSGWGENSQIAVNYYETAKWLGKTLNVPASLINESLEV